VSLGAKLSGFAKFGKSGPMLLKMVERINKVEDLVKTMKGGDNTKPLCTGSAEIFSRLKV
jgi:hypothetical protein